MFARDALKSLLFFLLAFQLVGHGVFARPQFSIANRKPGTSPAKRTDDGVNYKTNAERMRAGLPPRSPKRFYEPTRVRARDPQASGVSYSGTIRALQASNNQPVGWIRTMLHSSGRLQLTTGGPGRMSFSFTYPSNGSPFEISISDSSDHGYLGAVGSTLQSNNNSRNGLVRTKSVPAGSTPQDVGNSSGSGGSESFMWFFNTGTNELTAQWINPSGSVTSVYFYYEDAGPNTGLWISANSNLGGGYTPVRLYLS